MRFLYTTLIFYEKASRYIENVFRYNARFLFKRIPLRDEFYITLFVEGFLL